MPVGGGRQGAPFIFLAVIFVACANTPPPPEQKPLLAEFAGAYSADSARPDAVRAFDLVAAPATLTLLDGRPLHVWAYNGHVPGPTFRVRVGERVRVTFVNRLPVETTVHWHGVRVPNVMDGAAGVTQLPVPPGGRYVYEFVPKDAGTFWFHPHIRSSEQVERGLFGVLVVQDREPPPYSRDVVWVVDDWRLGLDGQIDPHFNTPHDLAHDGRWGNVVTVNGRTAEELVVRPGERLRLRLVNTANGRVFRLDWGGLDARIIAVDGMYARAPVDPTGFELSPGNRLDLDVRIPATGPGRWVVTDHFTRNAFPVAAIRSAGKPLAAPEFPPPTGARVPAWREAAAIAPAKEYALDARPGGPFGLEWMLGDDGPHAHHARTLLPRGRFTKLRFTNRTFRLHPMHVHGMFFKVLARNGVAVDEPFWRDTALVHAQETVDVGMVPLDAGRWMLHCHVLEHQEAGMMTTVEVR
jgi:FtsP/CotA-like multicopper oxidase with cupredoxin domain